MALDFLLLLSRGDAGVLKFANNQLWKLLVEPRLGVGHSCCHSEFVHLEHVVVETLELGVFVHVLEGQWERPGSLAILAGELGDAEGCLHHRGLEDELGLVGAVGDVHRLAPSGIDQDISREVELLWLEGAVEDDILVGHGCRDAFVAQTLALDPVKRLGVQSDDCLWWGYL